jgi:hypothetical protein
MTFPDVSRLTAVLTDPGVPDTSKAPDEVTIAPTPDEPVTIACVIPADDRTIAPLVNVCTSPLEADRIETVPEMVVGPDAST